MSHCLGHSTSTCSCSSNPDSGSTNTISSPTNPESRGYVWTEQDSTLQFTHRQFTMDHFALPWRLDKYSHNSITQNV